MAALASFSAVAIVWAQTPTPQGPDMAMEKVETSADSNGQHTYTLTVRNNGSVQAVSPVTVTDTLSGAPPGTSFVSASGAGFTCTGAPGPGPVNCATSSTFAFGPGGMLIITVVVSSPPGSTFQNCATVGQGRNPATLPDPNLANNSSCALGPTPTPIATTPPVLPPDLAIQKNANVSGQTVTYSLVVTNIGGTGSASPVTVTETLTGQPVGTTFTSAGGGGFACTGAPGAGPVTCTNPNSLPPNGPPLTITVVVQTPSGNSSFQNCASVSSPSASVPVETNFANNRSCTTVTVAAPTFPDLAIAKSGSISSDGLTATYTLTVSNVGTLPTHPLAGPITVTDTLTGQPSGTVFSSASGAGWTCPGLPGATLVCSYANSIVPGDPPLTLTVVVTLPPGAPAFQNCATVTSPSNVAQPPDQLLTNNTACVRTEPPPPGRTGTIVIVKDTQPNGPQIFTFTVTPPSGPLQGATLDNDGNNSNNLSDTKTFGNLAAGVYTVTEDTVSGWSVSGISCNPSTGTTAVTATRTVTINLTAGSTVTCTFANAERPSTTGSPDLLITKTQSFSADGLTATYTLTVTNVGTATASGPITVTDTLSGQPIGTAFVSASGSGFACTGAPGSGPVICTYPSSLAPSSPPLTVSLVVSIPRGGPAFQNCATVASPSNATVEVTVPSTVAGGVNTGIVIPAGGSVVITASGTWYYTTPGLPNGPPVGPNGVAPFVLNGVQKFSLVASVNGGPFQFVGAGPTTINGPGTLTLAMNDDLYGDNSGSMLAVITSSSGDLNQTNNTACVRTEPPIPGATGTIVIVKDAQPNGAQVFTFTVTPPSGPLQGATLDNDGNNGNNLSDTKTFGNLAAGVYTVTEDAVSGWSVSGIACNPSTGTTAVTATGTVTISLAAGTTVTCTFANVQTQQPPSGTTYVYSVKYVCGYQERADLVVPGVYRTAINVHNFTTSTITIDKKAVIALPEDEPRGAISKWVQDRLRDDEALDVSCSDVVKLMANVGVTINPSTGLVTGFVEIRSPIELQITAVYTMADTTGRGVSMDVEHVLPHVIKQ